MPADISMIFLEVEGFYCDDRQAVVCAKSADFRPAEPATLALAINALHFFGAASEEMRRNEESVRLRTDERLKACPPVFGLNVSAAAPVGAMYAITTFEDGIKVIKSLNALLTLGWQGDIGKQLFETREQLKKDIRSVKVYARPCQMPSLLRNVTSLRVSGHESTRDKPAMAAADAPTSPPPLCCTAE